MNNVIIHTCGELNSLNEPIFIHACDTLTVTLFLYVWQPFYSPNNIKILKYLV